MERIVIEVDANLLRIAHIAASTEATRWYLNGVYVEPRPEGGAYLVATDGWILACIYDPTAVATKGEILSLDKAGLAACKPKRDDASRRAVLDASGSVMVRARSTIHGAPETAVLAGARVEGTFPDWRRALAPALPEGVDTTAAEPAYRSIDLERLGRIGAELRGFKFSNMTVRPGARRKNSDLFPGDAAQVRWSMVDNAFGAVMPVRPAAVDFPEWFTKPRP